MKRLTKRKLQALENHIAAAQKILEDTYEESDDGELGADGYQLEPVIEKATKLSATLDNTVWL